MYWNHFKRGYWNETQEHNKKLIRKNGLVNRLGIIDFKFNRFLVSKDILLNRDWITQELIDEFKGVHEVEFEDAVPEAFENLKAEADDLKSQFDLKEKKVREAIEMRFPSPQLTNDRFNSIVDSSAKIFSKRLNAIMMMIHSAGGYSPKVEGKIKSNIEVLEKINAKLDAMTDELLSSMPHCENHEVDDLLEEMKFYTDAIHNYD